MIEQIRQMFRKPSADMLAQRELEDSMRGLLEAQQKRDYYTHIVGFYQTLS